MPSVQAQIESVKDALSSKIESLSEQLGLRRQAAFEERPATAVDDVGLAGGAAGTAGAAGRSVTQETCVATTPALGGY